MAPSGPAILDIPPAKLLSKNSHIVPGALLVTELFFQVPLDYTRDIGTITLFARSVAKHDTPIVPSDEDASVQKPYLVYLEGGPGFGNREPQDHPLTRPVLSRGYQVLLLDHRGVGLSTPVSADMLSLMPGVEEKANYLSLMRQDNTVRDCEAVRKCLTQGWPELKRPWSIFGQSYGGFVSLSYLSMHPEGLREVFATGGLAPIGKTPKQVYQATFRKTYHRNNQYYGKFPEDIQNVRDVASYIESKGGSIPLPSGGKLTVPRLLTLGIAFGGHGGFDSVHGTILRLKTSLDQFGFLTRASLTLLEDFTPFDSNIIYAIIHEAIYCDGPQNASRWAAYRVGKADEAFPWLNDGFSVSSTTDRLNFSGEMVFPFHFETYPELITLREVADRLAQRDDWPSLYNLEKLAANKVPMYAVSYVEDMYVDSAYARDTAKLVNGIEVFETNVMYHSALRAKTEEVLKFLFDLRDDVLD